MKKQSIALVIPWYGDDIRGGAEWECNFLAHSLQKAGVAVEVFTTCVKDAPSDRGVNTMKPGVYEESGICVRRFLVKEQNKEIYNPANLKIYNGEKVTEKEEQIYFDEDINSPDMYEYIKNNKDNYRCFIFMPYLYGVTYNGSKVSPEKSILIPCLHDESYAYLKLTKKMMERVKGLAFLANPEQELANKLFDLSKVHNETLGAGVETEWYGECNAERFREKYNLHNNFILFAGRKDTGKKADELLKFFCKYIDSNPKRKLDLVFLGGGTLEIAPQYKELVHDLGFVSTEDKHDALSAATFLCNPSHFESFSIVIMESWLAKRPVLVSSHCEVTKNFASKTNGGLWFKNYAEFVGCVDYLLDHSDVRDVMGKNGFDYVMNNFTQEKIAEKYLKFIEMCGL